MAEELFRTNGWLRQRVDALKLRYFADVQGGYPIQAHFGRRSTRRWGTIHAAYGYAVITINSLFRAPEVPEMVIDGTILHELAHYAHGFGSGLPKRYRYPHAGGVVEAELQRRGCLQIERQSDDWLREHWSFICDRYAPDLMAVRQRKPNAAWARVLSGSGWRTEEELAGLALRVARALGEPVCPFRVEWLQATKRQQQMSYRVRGDGRVQLHGLLGSRRVADSVLLCEIGTWIVTPSGRCTMQQLQAAFENAGLAREWQEAERFRAKEWPVMCKAHHVLWD